MDRQTTSAIGFRLPIFVALLNTSKAFRKPLTSFRSMHVQYSWEHLTRLSNHTKLCYEKNCNQGTCERSITKSQ